MRFRKVPWQRSFAKLPSSVLNALDAVSTPLVTVAQAKSIPLSDIASGHYKHLGLTLANGAATVGEAVLPPANFGKWSVRNREGWERKRTDLPKITKTYTWETPNFGDASTYGTHTSYRDREVYQVEFDEPRGHKIKTEILKASDGTTPAVLVKFSIDTMIDRQAHGLEKELLWALNVLQESTGVAGVYPSDATRQDYLGTIELSWEIFPPGTADEVIVLLRKRRKGKATKPDLIIEDRLKLFDSLKPSAYLAGTAKFAAYIGAKFAEDLVVFENVHYGNALYVLYDDWRDISRRSRIDLLRGTSERFDRFVHTEGWEERFLSHMQNEMDRRKPRRRHA
jgi:hypothetical protein